MHLQLSFCISLHILSRKEEMASVSLATGSEITEISTQRLSLKMALYCGIAFDLVINLDTEYRLCSIILSIW